MLISKANLDLGNKEMLGSLKNKIVKMNIERKSKNILMSQEFIFLIKMTFVSHDQYHPISLHVIDTNIFCLSGIMEILLVMHRSKSIKVLSRVP